MKLWRQPVRGCKRALSISVKGVHKSLGAFTRGGVDMKPGKTSISRSMIYAHPAHFGQTLGRDFIHGLD